MEGTGLDHRRNSNSSSQGSSVGSDWTLLNVQGSEIDNISTQTSPREPETEVKQRKLSVSSCETAEFERVTEDSEQEEDGEEEREDLDETHSTLAGDVFQEDLVSDTLEHELNKEPKMYIDPTQVTRLLDALAARMENVQWSDDALVDGSFSDELPVNFVQRYANKMKNYVHTPNSKLNWTLKLIAIVAAASVVGLGLGHFIGSTHSWIVKQRLQKQQIEQMKSLQDGLVTCLDKLNNTEESCQSEITSLRLRAIGCKQSQSSCALDDKPTCVGTSQQLSACYREMYEIQSKLFDAQDSLTSKATVNRYLTESKSKHQQRTGVLSSALSHSRAKIRRLERKMEIMNKRLIKQTSELERTRVDSSDLQSQEMSLRQIIAQLENNNQHLKASLLDAEREAMQISDQLTQCKAKSNEPHSSQGCSMDQFLDMLKNAGNLSDTLAAYLPELHTLGKESGERMMRELRNLNTAFDEMKTSVKSQLKQMTESDKIEQVYDQAKDFSQQMGSALAQAWQQTKDVAETVHKEHADKLTAFMSELWESTKQKGWDLAQDKMPELFPHPSPDPPPTPSHNTPPPQCSPRPVTPHSDFQIRSELLQLRATLKRSSFWDMVGDTNCRHYLARLKLISKLDTIDEANADWWSCQRRWWAGQETGACRFLLQWQKDMDRLGMRRGFLAENRALEKLVIEWMEDVQLDEEEDEGFCEDPLLFPNTPRTPEPDHERYGPWPRPLVLDDDDDWSEEPARPTSGKWQFKRANGRTKERQEEAKSDWLFDRFKQREKQRKRDEREFERADWSFKRAKNRQNQREEKWKAKRAGFFARTSAWHF